MQKTLITVLYYNKFNIILIEHYTAVLIAYWHYIFYHLQLTKLYNNDVYIFKYW
jgi:hypothetical protein